MKVFISWSGDRSREVASLLSDWLQCVLQVVRPWISTRDIGPGSLWFNEIGEQLAQTTIGVVCLTQENKVRPWILFEAGALAKGLSTSRVCTFLVDLKPADLDDPLAQFNHTFPTRESVFALVKMLNYSASPALLQDGVLDQVFQTYWPQFEQRFAAALKKTEPTSKVEPKEEGEVLSEILENTRALRSRVSALERSLPAKGVHYDHLLPRSWTSPSDLDPLARALLDSPHVTRNEVIKTALANGKTESWAENVIALIERLAFLKGDDKKG